MHVCAYHYHVCLLRFTHIVMIGRIDFVSNGELVGLFINPKEYPVYVPSSIPIFPVTLLTYTEVCMHNKVYS